MAAVVYLYVDRLVASLQLDIQTTGRVTPLISPSLQKIFSTGRRSDGKLRVIVFGSGQQTFAGKFAGVDALVTGISGVISTNPDGGDAEATVSTLSKIGGLKITLSKNPDESNGPASTENS